jgi:hypothetical protein
MAPGAVDNSTVLAGRTTVSDADPYMLAIEQIRAAITRHRTNKESWEDTRDNSTPVEGAYISKIIYTQIRTNLLGLRFL